MNRQVHNLGTSSRSILLLKNVAVFKVGSWEGSGTREKYNDKSAFVNQNIELFSFNPFTVFVKLLLYSVPRTQLIVQIIVWRRWNRLKNMRFWSGYFIQGKKLYVWFMISISSVSDSVTSKQNSSRLLFPSHKLAYSKVITCFLAWLLKQGYLTSQ